MTRQYSLIRYNPNLPYNLICHPSIHPSMFVCLFVSIISILNSIQYPTTHYSSLHSSPFLSISSILFYPTPQTGFLWIMSTFYTQIDQYWDRFPSRGDSVSITRNVGNAWIHLLVGYDCNRKNLRSPGRQCFYRSQWFRTYKGIHPEY